MPKPPDPKVVLKTVSELSRALSMTQSTLKNYGEQVCKGKKGGEVFDTYKRCTDWLGKLEGWYKKMRRGMDAVTKIHRQMGQKKTVLSNLVWDLLMMSHSCEKDVLKALNTHRATTQKWSRALSKVKH